MAGGAEATTLIGLGRGLGGMPVSRKPLGAILAGGLARRMGGGDKSLRTIGGRTILDHVIARLRPQCASLLVNANGDPARFAAYGLPVVADSVPGFAGPLAGILAALDHAADQDAATDVVSVAADTPFLPRDLVGRLIEGRAAQGAALACAASGGRTHPVIGLWPVAIRHELRQALALGERKIDRFTARYRFAAVSWDVDLLDPFFNANRPEDLEEAERLLASSPD